MELKTDSTTTATVTYAAPTGPRCQANIGTDDNPEACGERMSTIDDWTFLCKKHGEMR